MVLLTRTLTLVGRVPNRTRPEAGAEALQAESDAIAVRHRSHLHWELVDEDDGMKGEETDVGNDEDDSGQDNHGRVGKKVDAATDLAQTLPFPPSLH